MYYWCPPSPNSKRSSYTPGILGTHANITIASLYSRPFHCPQHPTDPEADQEASEMLTDNAQNLMGAVSEVLFATEAATIRVPPAEREKLGLQWVKRC